MTKYVSYMVGIVIGVAVLTSLIDTVSTHALAIICVVIVVGLVIAGLLCLIYFLRNGAIVRDKY